MGFNCETLEVVNAILGDYAFKFHVRSKVDGFRWALVTVYGATQPEFKPDFLADPMRVCGDERLPILIGGDFNMIRRREGKIMIISMGGGHLCLMLSSRV